MSSALEKHVTDAAGKVQPGAAIDFAVILQIITTLMGLIGNCPFGGAKRAMKAGSTEAKVAIYNAVKKSGFGGNAVDLTNELIERGKNASDEELDATIESAMSLPGLSKFGAFLLAIALCGSTALAGPFPSVADGPFPLITRGGDQESVVTVVTPSTGSGDERPSIPTAPEPSLQKPIVTIWSPETSYCPHCEQMAAQDWSNEPYRIVKLKADDLEEQLRKQGYQGEFEGYPVSVWTGGDGRMMVRFGLHTPRQLTGSWRQTQQATEATVEAEDSTPYSEIARAFEAIKLQPDQVVVDPGCDDGRALIVAVEQFGTKRAIGVEIDPARAAAARERVEQAGLSDHIEIITGDSTTMNLQGDVAFVYLYPPTLEVLRPQLQKFDTVISYLHRIPGLATTERDGLHIYQRQTVASQQTTTQERPYAIYQGWKFYGPCCNDVRRCGMRAEIMRQLAAREHVEVFQVAVATPCGQSGCSGQACTGSGCARRGCSGCSRRDD